MPLMPGGSGRGTLWVAAPVKRSDWNVWVSMPPGSAATVWPRAAGIPGSCARRDAATATKSRRMEGVRDFVVTAVLLRTRTVTACGPGQSAKATYSVVIAAGRDQRARPDWRRYNAHATGEFT